MICEDFFASFYEKLPSIQKIRDSERFKDGEAVNAFEVVPQPEVEKIVSLERSMGLVVDDHQLISFSRNTNRSSRRTTWRSWRPKK